MADFPPAFPPFGTPTEVFPDVFFVSGGFRFGPGLSIGRNMTIIRQGEELTLVNSVRLSPDGEAALCRLGNVKHLLRIGRFHGLDDPYYMDRFSPTLWAPPTLRHQPPLQTHRELTAASCPIAGAKVFAFEKGKEPEVAILLERDGGILITCDCYQNWTTFDDCSFLGSLLTRAMGFGPTHIGGPWVKAMGPGVRADFDRLLDAPFRHLLPGHGTVLRDRAKEGLQTAIARRFK